VRLSARGACLLLLLGAGRLCAGAQQEELTLLYTASLNGNLDGCTCVSGPKAGLIKRAAFLRSLPGRDKTILVDGGDVFGTYDDATIAADVLKVYGELGYDAVGVGDQDLVNGVASLLARLDSFPFLSNNLSLCDDKACVRVSPQPRLVTRGGRGIGLLSLIEERAFSLYPPEVKDRVKITPPDAAARSLVPFLRGEGAEMVLLIFHGSLEGARRIARQVADIDVIVVAHEQMLVDGERVGRTLIVSPGEEGNRVGILHLGFSGGRPVVLGNEFRLFRYKADPDDPEVRHMIDEYWAALKAAS
jgi:2',3'-cyclic-nucleotide 2'-phosphodiesterase (5'-nucleotidase family)